MTHPETVRWPAEWEPHSGTWLTWPHAPDTWPDITAVERAYTRAIAALAGGETVHLAVPDQAVAARAHAALAAAGASAGVHLHTIPTNDSWVRDYGPVVVLRGGVATALDFRFNAWGGKYPPWEADDAAAAAMARATGLPLRRLETVLEGGAIEGNGAGLVMTTEPCVTLATRNAHFDRTDFEALAAAELGADEVIWLSGDLVGDDTDGHVDNLCRFVSERTVIAMVEPDRSEPNHACLAENVARLTAWRGADGRGLTVIELEMPEPVHGPDGARLPVSYANFLIGNSAVLLPCYTDGCSGPRDLAARELLGSLFAGRDIVAVDSRAVVPGFGAWHCLSQQVPATPPDAPQHP